MTETCAGCGKPINFGEPSYYSKDPTCDIGKSYHTTCGDPFGIKAKDAEIERLRTEVADWKQAAGVEADLRREFLARAEAAEAALSLQDHGKLEISKDWCLRAAEREGDSEVGAGVMAMDPTLCDDCPPVGYPTDKTRCVPCPRRVSSQERGK